MSSTQSGSRSGASGVVGLLATRLRDVESRTPSPGRSRCTRTGPGASAQLRRARATPRLRCAESCPHDRRRCVSVARRAPRRRRCATHARPRRALGIASTAVEPSSVIGPRATSRGARSPPGTPSNSTTSARARHAGVAIAKRDVTVARARLAHRDVVLRAIARASSTRRRCARDSGPACPATSQRTIGAKRAAVRRLGTGAASRRRGIGGATSVASRHAARSSARRVCARCRIPRADPRGQHRASARACTGRSRSARIACGSITSDARLAPGSMFASRIDVAGDVEPAPIVDDAVAGAAVALYSAIEMPASGGFALRGGVCDGTRRPRPDDADDDRDGATRARRTTPRPRRCRRSAARRRAARRLPASTAATPGSTGMRTRSDFGELDAGERGARALGARRRRR